MVSAKDDFIAKARRNMAFAVVFGIGSVGLAIACLAMNRGVIGAFGLVFACLNVVLFVINRNAVHACRQSPERARKPRRNDRPPGGAPGGEATRGTRPKPRGKGRFRRRQRTRPPRKDTAAQPTPAR